jgi:hypothetical protein
MTAMRGNARIAILHGLVRENINLRINIQALSCEIFIS